MSAEHQELTRRLGSPCGASVAPGIAVIGLIGCVTLALALPLTTLLIGGGVLAVGAAARLLLTRSRRTAAGEDPT